MIGKTLGHYQITSELGRGGMGEVYQAKDQKLGRDVAIKVLPDEFAKDGDRVTRFQREAKVLASLNHPNIAAIYGLEEFGGTNFLVLELVEGETLADRIKVGPIPVEESLKLALQIAEALEAAHEKGIIHRDLKPANIKVTPDGKVKVLDFGLAKAYAAEQSELNLSNSPTLSNAATQQGTILGTAAYMSPEQARGKPVDKRADIWAFGCVLYEMLTGQQTWSGATVTDILAAALAKEPDFTNLPPNLHPDIGKLLRRCLQKNPMERFRDMGDVRVEIKQAFADPFGVLVPPAAGAEPKLKPRRMLVWIAAAVVLTAIVAGVAVWILKPTEPRQVMRFDYELPEGQQITGLDVSPNGKQLVYSTSKGLYLRPVDELSAKFIAGTEGDIQQPFFSPDGEWIGYFSSGNLKKITSNGGTPVTLYDVGGASGASWGADNTILYGKSDIMRISENGGTPESIVKRKSHPVSIGFPQILPGGKSVLYSSGYNISQGQSKIMVQSLKTGETKELCAGVGARYLPTGHIVYSSGNAIMAVPFDLKTLEVTGRPVPVIEGVLRMGYAPQYAVSDSGTLVYMPGETSSPIAGRTLVWVDRQGKEEPIGAPPNPYRYPKLSPDGTRTALTIWGDDVNIWVWDLVRKTLTRLTSDKMNVSSIWSPDGKKIVFASNSEGNFSLYWKSADGTGGEEKLGSMPGLSLLPGSWSRDGKTLLTAETNLGSKGNIGVLSMEGEHTRRTLILGEATPTSPRISPDGRWIAYVSRESGKDQVYVRPFPDVNKGKWQVSTNGGDGMLWSPDGRELFYLTEDNSVMAVAAESKSGFSLGTPKTLFRSIYVGLNSTENTPWDIHPDGKRFLMMKPPGTSSTAEGGPRKINIVLNWIEELKQRVPVK